MPPPHPSLSPLRSFLDHPFISCSRGGQSKVESGDSFNEETPAHGPWLEAWGGISEACGDQKCEKARE